MHLLVLDHHDSFVHNILQLLRESEGVTFDRIQTEALDLHQLNRYDGVILSPGPCTPVDYPNTQQLITSSIASDLPILGICLGHQAIAEHFGAKLYQLPAPLHGHASRLTRIDSTDSVVGWAHEGSLIGRYHSWAVDISTLPECLLATSFSEEPGEGFVLMSLRHQELPIWGLQFHPESMITERGKDYISGFLAHIAH